VYSCSILLFLFRAIIQLIFFTPKASPFDPTRNQPYIGAIFSSNIFCMIFHAFFIWPEVDETTRGYLHGGLFIDFIGQKGPVSVGRLISFDLLVMVVDFVMLGLVIERVRTVDSTSESQSQSQSQSGAGAEAEAERQQDHDSEERGVLRDQNRDDGIELDELVRGEHTPSTQTNNPNTTANDIDDERTNLLAEPSSNAHTKPTHPLDIFSSGEYMLMDIGLIDIIRDQWHYSPSSMSSGRSTTTSSARTSRTSRYVPSAETAAFLRERFGLQVSADGSVERIER